MLTYRIAAALFLMVILTGSILGTTVIPDSTLNKSTNIDSLGIPPDTTLKKNSGTDSLQIMMPADPTSKNNSTADSLEMIIPADTKLMIYFYESISTAKPSGSSFSGILDEDFTFNGSIIAPKGSIVKGKILESSTGSKLTFRFTGLIVNGTSLVIETYTAGVEGRDNIGNVVGPVTFKGGAFAGGTAGNGAPITGGLTGLHTGKNDIEIAAGTLMIIPLKEPLVIK